VGRVAESVAQVKWPGGRSAAECGEPQCPEPAAADGAALASRVPAGRLFQRGIKLDRLLPIRPGLCVIALLGVDPAPRHIRGGVAGVEADRFPEVRQRPVVIARPGVGHPPMVPGTGVVRVEPNRLAEVRNGSVPVPLI
jgi:hypothetical protein